MGVDWCIVSFDGQGLRAVPVDWQAIFASYIGALLANFMSRLEY